MITITSLVFPLLAPPAPALDTDQSTNLAFAGRSGSPGPGLDLAGLNHGAESASGRIQCADSVILWVLGKQFIPLLPVCLIFTMIVQSLPVSAAQKEDRHKTMAIMGMMEDFMV